MRENIYKNKHIYMLKLSQNKKIAVCAIALFLISFSVMLFFLENKGDDLVHSAANVLHGTDHDSEHVPAPLTNEDHYRSFLAEEDAIMFVTNGEGEFTHLSDDFCDLLEVDCENLAGNLLFDYINVKDLSTAAAAHTRLIQQSEPMEGLGPYRMLKGNEEVFLLLNAYPVLDSEGRVSEIVFSVKDLTSQVEELNNGEEDDEDRNWIYDLYPKIREMNDQHEIRMMVDRISYKGE